MLNKVKAYIKKENILNKQKKYLVGLSGGADSIALLLILKQLGYQIEAAHCNFNLRGTESKEDEVFCQNLCQKEGISLHIAHFDTSFYAQVHKVSIEMAARELRYNYFSSLINDINADGVCIAHHKDDMIETSLLNLIRGTGMTGLIGIRPIQGKIYRPLLDCTKEEIYDYLAQKEQEYKTDSSNLTPKVKRNKLRLNIIPELNTINPSFSNAISALRENLLETEKIVNEAIKKNLPELLLADKSTLDFYHSIIERQVSVGSTTYLPTHNTIEGIKKPSKVQIDKGKLSSFASPLYLLYVLVTPFGFNSTQIHEINTSLAKEAIKSWKSKHYELIIDRDCIYIIAFKKDEIKPFKLPIYGKYVYKDNITIKLEQHKIPENFTPSKANNIITINADNLIFPLTLRLVEDGDKFKPYGMNGHKLVNDLLTDLKIPLIDKRNQLVLVNGDHRIIWVVGLRIDNHFAIDSDSKSFAKISITT